MTAAALIDAFCFPADARVDQRVAKKLLVENGAPTPADKRQINDGIEDLIWVAALKPTNIGVPVFRDEVREYLEIAVISATLRPQAKASRVAELIHRAIPYPVVLITSLAETRTLSLAHKRWSQGEAGKVVLEEGVHTAILMGLAEEPAFLAALPLTGLPRQNLHALYQGWIDATTALTAALLTGAFVVAESPEASTVRRAALEEHARLLREMAGLRAAAVKEKQLNRRVELNLAIQRLEAQLAAVVKTI